MHVLKGEEDDYGLPLLLKGFRNGITKGFVGCCLRWIPYIHFWNPPEQPGVAVLYTEDNLSVTLF